ncbi:MAG TPA: presqualene diphosphate synthase HpnD [Streptosporangiaceae bacterium]|nr:presqualene diphosphate synthase HpnD [Streptosporangiaceae bacterium]
MTGAGNRVTGTVTETADVQAAYRQCETITRQQAKNFAYGIALLPAPKRRALSAVYALARRIDDIGDGTLPQAEKIAELAAARESVAQLASGGTAADAVAAGDPVLLALQHAAQRFPIPVAAFGELIDGCEADVRGTRYTTFGELEHYCRCVAGSIGRLSLGVFGSSDPAAAEPLADDLGVALQLTNILRDITEDLGNGRVYLPAEDLRKFGCTLTAAGDGHPASMSGQMTELIRFEASRARDWYDSGLRLLRLLDRRSAACTGAMAGIYSRLLDHIAAQPRAALEHRMSLPARQKAVIALTALAGLARPGRGSSDGQTELGAPARPAEPAPTRSQP